MARNLKDAFYNAQYRVGQGIITRAVSQGDNSLTESNFTGNDTLDALAQDGSAMPEFANSQVCMSDISSNSVGMSTIASYQTAMDAVAASQTAMDAVAGSQTAMDAVAASQTAMDAVAGSQTAMDAVAGSQTAMDAVMPSTMARTKLLGSSNANGTVWESSLASQRVWDEDSPITDAEPWTVEIDFTNISSIRIWTQSNIGGRPATISVGGTQIYNNDADDGTWLDETLDVSSYSGTQTLELSYGGGNNLDIRDLQENAPSGYSSTGLKTLHFNESGESYDVYYYGLRFVTA